MTNPELIHKLLLEKAASLGLPKAFHRDLLVHDLTTLQEVSDSQRLLWGIGECGTHMIRLNRVEMAPYYVHGIGSVDHWFLLENGVLTEVSK